MYKLILAVIIASSPLLYAQNTQSGEWDQVSKALGRSGTVQSPGVYRVGLPRTDLRVRIDDVEIKPALALGGWVAFQKTPHGTMVMGDLVLTEEEVAPVTARLQSVGLQQTAIHNHLLRESPQVVYMHVEGHGDVSQLANGLRQALAVTKIPPPSPAAASELSGIDQSQVEKVLGRSGKVNGGVLQFGVPRKEKITEDSVEIPPAMGTATSLEFSAHRRCSSCDYRRFRAYRE